jgi:hypothetical protein
MQQVDKSDPTEKEALDHNEAAKINDNITTKVNEN